MIMAGPWTGVALGERMTHPGAAQGRKRPASCETINFGQISKARR